MSKWYSIGLLLWIQFTLCPSVCGWQPQDSREDAEKSVASRFDATVTPAGVFLSERERPILFFQTQERSLNGRWSRSNYVHPLYSLSGKVLTEDFPADHRHHRGLFWAWHQVWVGESLIGDPWLCQDFEWMVSSPRIEKRESAILVSATAIWKSPLLVNDAGEKISIAREEVTITAHRQNGDTRAVDFSISLTALIEDVRIAGSDDPKGYGGFSARIKLHRGQEFSSHAGVIEPTRLALDAGPWIDVSDDQRGVALISHSQNPLTPKKWILRKKASMQNAVYPGRTPIALSKVDPVVLRYRVVVHQGRLSNDEIDKLHLEFESGE